MRRYAVAWAPLASLDLLATRTFLGPRRGAELDEDLERVRERLSALPESGAPVKVRGKWTNQVRRISLSRSPYHLFYRVNAAAERVVIISFRHERRRPPRL